MFITRVNSIISSRIKIFTVLIALIYVTGAHGKDIIENEVEDLDTLSIVSLGSEPNVLMIFDSSISMGTSFAGAQIGNQDGVTSIETCGVTITGNTFDVSASTDELYQVCADEGTNSDQCRAAVAHCVGNAAGLNPVGSIACSGSRNGSCEEVDQFEAFINGDNGVKALYGSVLGGDAGVQSQVFDVVVPTACNPVSLAPFDPITECDTFSERAVAAAAIENYALSLASMVAASGFSDNCGSLSSTDCVESTTSGDHSCNESGNNNDFNNYMGCIQDTNLHPTQEECNNGISVQVGETTLENPNCAPGLRIPGENGSTRSDTILSVFFDFLDADDSLKNIDCRDENGLLTGTNNATISCHEYINTPFRDVGSIVTTQSGRLPKAGGGNGPTMTELLDVNDQQELGLRLRPITYGLGGAPLSGNSSCTANNLIAGPQGGFAGGSQLNIDNVWKFFRNTEPGGRSMLAGAIGFDDNFKTNSTFGDDALRDFELQLKTGGGNPECSANFAIVITNGQDQCSGDDDSATGGLPNYVEGPNNTPPETGFANRRSSIAATTNLRDHFVNNNLGNGESANSEVLTFVICLGVNDQHSIRTCNAMALAGGTHASGIITHLDPNGNEVGVACADPSDPDLNCDTTPVLTGSGSEIDALRKLAIAFNFQPLGGCQMGQENESGQCTFNGQSLFDNDFFTDSADPVATQFDGTDSFTEDAQDSFAFFANNPEDLAEAINRIIDFVNTIPSSGISPVAPQSAAFVSARDRILLLPFRPIVNKRFWQGRLALYGFIPEPDNPGSRVVIKKPGPGDDTTSSSTVDGLKIFADDGSLNLNAQEFFWEAGKNLAETLITPSVNPRNLLTAEIDPTFTDTSIVDTSNGNIRYIGDLIDFDKTLIPEFFGISNADVTGSSGNIPSFCTPDSTQPDTCVSSGGGSNIDCTDTTTAACQTCVKECIRDRIVDFMSGNTEIETRDDPLGGPTEDLCPATGDGIIGCGCPDLELGTGSFSECSVRLGTIFHSIPTLVTSPSPLFFDSGFQAFARKYRNRAAAAYAGANDGFIHGFHAGNFVNPSSSSFPGNPSVNAKNPFTNLEEFVAFYNAGSGKEVLAFTTPSFFPDSISSVSPDSPAANGTPEFRFGDFKSFITENGTQRSFFDGATLAADVFIDGFPNNIPQDPSVCSSATISSPDGSIDECGREWHTVLLAGLRNGGGIYTALDVTNFACSGGSGSGEDRTFTTGQDECSVVEEHITGDLDYPEHLWTLFDQDFGNTWSQPTIGRARLELDDGDNTTPAVFTDRWLLFVGGGLHPTDTNPTDNSLNIGDSLGNGFYAIDIATGKIVFKFHPTNTVPSTIEDQPTNVSGIGVASDNNTTKMTCDMAARVGAFDINADGYIDIVLGGDTCGRLWEFDVSKPIVTNASVSQTGIDGNAEFEAKDWTGHILFCATGTDTECGDPTQIDNLPVADDGDEIDREPIFFDPTVVIDDIGRRHVILVTGNRRNLSDPEQSGKLYNFVDQFVPAFLGGGGSSGATTIIAGTKFNSTNTIEIVPDTNNPGFFTTSTSIGFDPNGEFAVIFPDNVGTINGEKGIGLPIVIQRVLLFTTFAPPVPDPNNPCTSGLGAGRVFALDFITGDPAFARIPGTEKTLQDAGVSDSEADLLVGLTAAEGVPAPAQLTFGTRGSVLVTIAFSGNTFLIWELPPFPSRTQTLYWEEIL